MDEKNWWESKETWTAIITALASYINYQFGIEVPPVIIPTIGIIAMFIFRFFSTSSPIKQGRTIKEKFGG